MLSVRGKIIRVAQSHCSRPILLGRFKAKESHRQLVLLFDTIES